MSGAQIGDLVEDGPGGGRWIYTDRRGSSVILRPMYGGTGSTKPAANPEALWVVKTRRQLKAEFGYFV